MSGEELYELLLQEYENDGNIEILVDGRLDLENYEADKLQRLIQVLKRADDKDLSIKVSSLADQEWLFDKHNIPSTVCPFYNVMLNDRAGFDQTLGVLNAFLEYI